MSCGFPLPGVASTGEVGFAVGAYAGEDHGDGVPHVLSDAQRFTMGLSVVVSGPIDVAAITRREGLRFVQKKEIAVAEENYW